MRIGEVSKFVGISNSAIRFYERNGLLNSKKILRGENGYRVYTQKDVEELLAIVKFKEFGLELKEIKFLLGEESNSCGELVSSLDQQIEKCKQMEKRIKDRIQLLSIAKNNCKSKCVAGNTLRTCQV